MFHAFALAVAAFAQANLTTGDVAGPRAALERFLELNEASELASEEGRALLSGELETMTAPGIGPLPPPDAIIMLSDGTAVARLPAQGEDRPDIYLYLRAGDDGRWTIRALRTLALTGVLSHGRRLLRVLASRTAEQEEMLRNAELTLAADASLRVWFSANRGALDRLLAAARANEVGPVAARGRRIDGPEVEELVRNLHVLMVSASDGLVLVTIGGILDNEVGFLHADDPALVPAIDETEFIWIEPVGGGWYLYKTT